MYNFNSTTAFHGNFNGISNPDNRQNALNNYFEHLRSTTSNDEYNKNDEHRVNW